MIKWQFFVCFIFFSFKCQEANNMLVCFQCWSITQLSVTYCWMFCLADEMDTHLESTNISHSFLKGLCMHTFIFFHSERASVVIRAWQGFVLVLFQFNRPNWFGLYFFSRLFLTQNKIDFFHDPGLILIFSLRNT